MRDLICDVISYCVFIGKMWVSWIYEKIVTENLKTIKDGNKRNFTWIFYQKDGLGFEFTAYEDQMMKRSNADVIYVRWRISQFCASQMTSQIRPCIEYLLQSDGIIVFYLHCNFTTKSNLICTLQYDLLMIVQCLHSGATV